MKDQELEVKFYVSGLAAIEARLLALGARLEHPRVHEVNLRFDLPDGSLRKGYRVLRLRQDVHARLTYKGPALNRDGVRVRQEIEFTVSDFEAAQAFLEALGYQVSMAYEKYRTTYALAEVEVALDEMPYGSFVEIEGATPPTIRAAAQALGLEWDAAAADSYAYLFEIVQARRQLKFRDLTFENFRGLQIKSEDLGVRVADVTLQA